MPIFVLIPSIIMYNSFKSLAIPLFFGALLFIAFTPCYSQINVGSLEFPSFKPGEFDKGDLAKFKETTTVFVYRDSDKADLNLWKKELGKVWDVTDLEFMSYSQYASAKIEGDHSYMTMGGIIKVSNNSTFTHIYLNLWMAIKGKKKTFARIELSPEFKTYNEFYDKLMWKKDEEKEAATKYLYSEAKFFNWYLGYIRNAMHEVSSLLKAEKYRGLFIHKEVKNLELLKKDTLFIPDYALIEYNKWNGKEDERIDIVKVMKKYPYPYKVIEDDALKTRLLDSTKTTYYLSYIKSSADKFVNIVEGKTGTFMYCKYVAMSYYLKEKDIETLIKAMKTK
ncbi:MAG: hypothetical protein KG003_00860 [Bacteroidetes bacterium]|nr:hypothetical protein [Bacteroidota bacterium]